MSMCDSNVGCAIFSGVESLDSCSIIFRALEMFAILRFLFFNSVLSTADVLTDLLTFLDLLDNNPNWAFLTFYWMWNPFLVHTAFFLFRKATRKSQASTTYSELMEPFGSPDVVHGGDEGHVDARLLVELLHYL